MLQRLSPTLKVDETVIDCFSGDWTTSRTNYITISPGKRRLREGRGVGVPLDGKLFHSWRDFDGGNDSHVDRQERCILTMEQ